MEQITITKKTKTTKNNTINNTQTKFILLKKILLLISLL